MATMAADAREIATTDYLNNCVDVDAHEMSPVQLWPQLFGEGAREFADLCATSPVLRGGGINGLYRPDLVEDAAVIDAKSVWHERGPSAPSAFDFRRRAEVMDAMGVERQLVYPGYGFVGLVLAYDPKSLELHDRLAGVDTEAMSKRAIQLHNEWCIRLSREMGDRIRPVALLSMDSLDQMMRDAQHLLDAGIRAVMIPNGAPPGGMSPADPALDPFWSLFEAYDVPVTFHIGTERYFIRSQNWDANVPAFAEYTQTLEVTIQPFRGSILHYATEAYLAALILGGVLERHPKLRLGSIEIGAQWVGPFAERMDLWAAQFKRRMADVISIKPSEYLNRQFRAAPFHFEDVAQYYERHPDCADIYCFATDYPHIEGGRNAKQIFSDKLAGFDETIRYKFFRGNGLLLMPD